VKLFPDTDHPQAAPAVEEAMRALSRVGSELLESYEALERRAQRVEHELGRTNAELERILDSLPTGVVVRDANGEVMRTNGAVEAILGSGAEALPEELAEAAEWRERDFTNAEGRRLVLAARRSPIVDPVAGEVGSVTILDDRTELVELSERLHGLDKLAALGNMAGGIAHEIRNPLNAVKGFAALLARRLEEGSQERAWAELIVEGADEANTILSSMLTVAQPERLERERVDGGELIESSIALAQRDMAPEVGESPWRVTSEGDVPSFEGDRIKLRQALRNLVANAMQAQPGGGEVHVELTLADDELVLRVTDAGPGISKDLARRVCDPFFTTRAEGTGLGLALVVTIAQLHGGRVEVSSNPAPLGGADVSLRIPYRQCS
jgi:two-component system sensor histidine kinase HydH